VSCMKPGPSYEDTLAKQKAFCDAFAELGTMSSAAAASGVGRSTAFAWQHAGDEVFLDLLAQGRARHAEKLEAMLFEVLAGSEEYGSKSRHWGNLLMFAIKKAIPAYRDADVQATIKDAEDAAALIKLLRSRKAADSQQPKVLEEASQILADNPPSV